MSEGIGGGGGEVKELILRVDVDASEVAKATEVTQKSVDAFKRQAREIEKEIQSVVRQIERLKSAAGIKFKSVDEFAPDTYKALTKQLETLKQQKAQIETQTADMRKSIDIANKGLAIFKEKGVDAFREYLKAQREAATETKKFASESATSFQKVIDKNKELQKSSSGGAGMGRGGGDIFGGGGAGGQLNPLQEFKLKINQVALALEDLSTKAKTPEAFRQFANSISNLRKEFESLRDKMRAGATAFQEIEKNWQPTAAGLKNIQKEISGLDARLEGFYKNVKDYGTALKGQEPQFFYKDTIQQLNQLEAAYRDGIITAQGWMSELKKSNDVISSTDAAYPKLIKAKVAARKAIEDEIKAMEKMRLKEFRDKLEAVTNAYSLNNIESKEAVAALRLLQNEYGDSSGLLVKLEKAISGVVKSDDVSRMKYFKEIIADMRYQVSLGTMSLQDMGEAILRLKVDDKNVIRMLQKELDVLSKQIEGKTVQSLKELREAIRLAMQPLETKNISEMAGRFLEAENALKGLKARFSETEGSALLLDEAFRKLEDKRLITNVQMLDQSFKELQIEFTKTGNVKAYEAALMELLAVAKQLGLPGGALNKVNAELAKMDQIAGKQHFESYMNSYRQLDTAFRAGKLTREQLIAELRLLRSAADGDSKSMNHLENAIARTTRAMGNMAGSLSFLGKAFKTAQHHAMWMVSGSLLFPLYNLPRALADTLKEIDVTMAKLKTVIQFEPTLKGDAAAIERQFNQLSDWIFKFGAYYGENVNKVGEVFYNVAQKYSKAADIIVVSNSIMKTSVLDNNKNVEETTRQVMSLVAQLGIVPRDLQGVMDKVIAAGIVVQASAGDILESWSRSASVMVASGVDIDTQIKIIASSIEATGASAERVGNSWKTIMTRMGGGVREVKNELAKFGLSIFDEQQNLKEFSVVLKEFGEIYASMSDEMRLQFMSKITGMRHIQTLMPFINEMEKVAGATERVNDMLSQTPEQLRATAEAAEKINLKTLARNTERLTVAWQAFVYNLDKSTALKEKIISLIGVIIKVGKWITENTKYILLGVKALAAYAIGMKAATLATKAWASMQAIAGTETVLMNSRLLSTVLLGPKVATALGNIGIAAKGMGLAFVAAAKPMLMVLAALKAIEIAKFWSGDEQSKQLGRLETIVEGANVELGALKDNITGIETQFRGLMSGIGFKGHFQGAEDEIKILLKQAEEITGKKYTDPYRVLGKFTKEQTENNIKIIEELKKLAEAKLQPLKDATEDALYGDLNAMMEELKKETTDAEAAMKGFPELFAETGDAAKDAANASSLYDAQLKQISLRVDRLNKDLDAYQKRLERQKKTTFELLDLLPGQMPTAELLGRFSTELSSLISSYNDDLLKTLDTKEGLIGAEQELLNLQGRLTNAATKYLAVAEKAKDVATSAPVETAKELERLKNYKPVTPRGDLQGVNPELKKRLDLYATYYANKYRQRPVVTAGKERGHNVGSKHAAGNAVDLRTRGYSYDAEDIAMFGAVGLKYRDERKRPAGQAVWTGEHLHIELLEGMKAVQEETKITETEYDKATEKMETSTEQVANKIQEVNNKILDLSIYADEHYLRTSELIKQGAQAISSVYDSVQNRQKDFYDWQYEAGKISYDEWWKQIQGVYQRSDAAVENLGVNIEDVQRRMIDNPLAFYEETSDAINTLAAESIVAGKAIAAAQGEEAKKLLKDQKDLTDKELTAQVAAYEYSQLYLQNMKLITSEKQKQVDRDFKRLELEEGVIEYQKQYEEMQLKKRGVYGLVEQAKLIDKYEKRSIANLTMQIVLKQLYKKTQADTIVQEEIQAQINALNLKREQLILDNAASRLDLEMQRIDLQNYGYKQQLEYMKLFATAEQERLLNLQAVNVELATANQKLAKYVELRLGRDESIEESDMLKDPEYRALLDAIADLNLEIVKLSPTLMAIMETARAATDAYRQTVQDNIKSVLMGEKSAWQGMVDVATERVQQIREAMAETTATAITQMFESYFGEVEEGMQGLISGIFGAFGLSAETDQEVLNKVYDPKTRSMRVTFGAGAFDEVAKKAGVQTGIGGLDFTDILKGTSKAQKKKIAEGMAGIGASIKGSFQTEEVETSRKGLYRDIAKTVGVQMIASQIMGNLHGAGYGAQIGGMLGQLAGQATGGIAGSLFSGLGAMGGPVGMIAGMALGSVLDNAFGSGRGEERRQQMAEQQEWRKQQMADIVSRYQALGLDMSESGLNVPEYIENSERSKFGLSGTSRWLEGGQAVYDSITAHIQTLDRMETAVKNYDNAMKQMQYTIGQGIGRFDSAGIAWGRMVDAYVNKIGGISWEWGNSLNQIFGKDGVLWNNMNALTPTTNMLSAQIELLRYHMGQMSLAGLQASDTFKELETTLFALEQKRYWAQIYQPIKGDEWLQQFGLKSDVDVYKAYEQAIREAFGVEGGVSRDTINQLALSIKEGVELLDSGLLEGPLADQIRNQKELLITMLGLMDTIDSTYLGQAAVGQAASLGESISGSAQIVQNDITFAVNAENFFATRTEMLNIAHEIASMIKQQGWIDPKVFTGVI